MTENPNCGIVFACVAPHGWTLIPELADEPDDCHVTRAAMAELGRRLAAADPEVIILATPHGFRVRDAIAIADVARMAGTLHHNGKTVEMNVPVDRTLVASIAKTADSRGIPVALARMDRDNLIEGETPRPRHSHERLWA